MKKRSQRQRKRAQHPAGRRSPWPIIALAAAAAIALVWAIWPDGPPLAEPAPTQRAASHTTPSSSGAASGSSATVSEGVLPVTVASSWQEIDNPARDGWLTEVYAEQAKHLLSDLAAMMIDRAEVEPATVEALCDEHFRAPTLLPAQLEVVFDDALFRVERVRRSDTTADADRTAPAGPAACIETARELATFWQPYRDRRHEVKVVRVAREGDEFVTHQYLAASGRGDERSIEQHALWLARWSLEPPRETTPPADPALRLRSIEVIEFEQTTINASRPLLVDTTAAVLQANEAYAAQFLYGMNHWLDRTQDLRYFSPLGNPGLAVADINGDGLDDLYVCQEANLPNRLFLQQPDGTAREVAAEWKVDWLVGSRSVLLVDLDNDADQDLVVAILGGVIIASNEGDRFEVRDVLATHDDTTSLCAADYDGDGDLDLYVCVDYPNDYFASASEVPVQGGAANRVYHDANGAGRNSLFRNDLGKMPGEWQFVDVTSEVGLDANNRRFSWAASWEDFDNDGDQDLYVANDFGRNNLYENRDGQFVDAAQSAQAEDSASGMSAAWGDINRDGWMDLYVGNMFSSAGGRVTYQPQFKPQADEEVRGRLQRFARGSTLFRNQGNSTFQDISDEAGVTLGRWAWSSNFVDINNDGWPDIAVANGYITADDTGDL